VKKKILGVFGCLLIVAMLTTPVFADPTKGQKASITLRWFRTDRLTVDEWWSNGVRHRHVHVWWNVVLEIDGGPTLLGTAFTERDAVRVMQSDGPNNVLNDYYMLTFDGGGFEGNALILTQNVGTPTFRVKAHGLLMGTGDFEGQTINAGHHWVAGGPPVWTGYLLKP
jgi:hypothetical protein